MKIPNIFTKIAKSNWGQKIYKKALDPKNDDFWNSTMPLLETTAASACYIAATHVQKNIDDKSKNAMQIQNVLSWVFSIALASSLNRGVKRFGDKIIKHLTPELMNDGHKVINAIQVGLPILSVTLINRFLLPTAFVPISSIIRDKAEKLGNKKSQGLDVKA